MRVTEPQGIERCAKYMKDVDCTVGSNPMSLPFFNKTIEKEL